VALQIRARKVHNWTKVALPALPGSLAGVSQLLL